MEAITAHQAFQSQAKSESSTCPDASQCPDYEQLSDYALARKVDDQDMSALEELYRRHHRRVYNLCLRMTNNVAEAEDLTQDTFVHLSRNAKSFRGESAFTTWLHRMTVNLILMRFRKKDRREQELDDEALTGAVGAVVIGGANRQAQMIDKVHLDKAVAQLPPGYKEVFVLHDVEGYGHEEIANMLGRSVGTSKSQLHKARTRLRKLLGAQTIAD